ncbi:MAG: hypothetical protein OXU66_15385 [Gammaproteobacteria bacterium]|nr:hypothetical protein [Gammaproteobacteria bacterium]MDD9960300.1 hypothetical protein [Gammaproteobacteria bacterium]
MSTNYASVRFYKQAIALASISLLSSIGTAAELQEETDIKFAFYSSAWGAPTDDGMRLIVYNQTRENLRLDSIEFLKDEQTADPILIETNLDIPPLGYAEEEFEYIELLEGDECIDRTLEENWRLAEVSNYTLNPSVRNLIIEDTDSFRIYQCIENVRTTWTATNTNIQSETIEWVLFHFETRRDN